MFIAMRHDAAIYIYIGKVGLSVPNRIIHFVFVLLVNCFLPKYGIYRIF